MKFKLYLLVTSLFVSTLFSCSKDDDSVTPNNTTELLARKWSLSTSVKTDAKTYAIPNHSVPLFGDDNTVTFNKDNTFTILDGGQPATGQWKLSNNDKTLTMIYEADSFMNLNIDSINSTDLNLSGMNVDITKNSLSEEELSMGLLSEIFLLTLDKSQGGTLDFSKEPDYNTLQLLVKGKAL